MAAKTPYHLSEHSAYTLVKPLTLTLAEMDRRVQHHLERLRMTDEDREIVVQTKSALETCRQQIEALTKRAEATR